ncbi:EF-hand domain-containing protein D2 homolog isoform X2 [Argopecten irradians]|uniref:EF-hand domain-containing protein D2 homolog isoform X2 n=1 Tax=Argopecten irradians TaxID=31199 RepID=UPI0037154DEB
MKQARMVLSRYCRQLKFGIRIRNSRSFQGKKFKVFRKLLTSCNNNRWVDFKGNTVPYYSNILTCHRELGNKKLCLANQSLGRKPYRYDTGRDKFIDFEELKVMMEKLGEAQTHLGLKAMIKEVDEDNDGKISFREFLLIFRKARAGELEEGSGLFNLYQNLDEVDVDKEGVKGAKNFFEAKIERQTQDKKFENEIKNEQEEKKRLQEEAMERKKAFKEKATFFTAAANN